MKNREMTRAELAELLRLAAERKMAERERLIMEALEDPDGASASLDMADWLDLDRRYTELAASYYSGEYENEDLECDEDLLLRLDDSAVSKRAYAAYLRRLQPAEREQERVAHAATEGLKRAIRDTLAGGR